MGRNSSSHPGGSASFTCSRNSGVLLPPLTLSPQVTLTCWEEDISAYRMHSSNPSNANINAEMGVIVFPSRWFPWTTEPEGGTECRSNSKTKNTRNSMSSASAGPAALIPTGILRPYGGKQPKRLLEDIQHNHGQKSTNKRKTDKQWLLWFSQCLSVSARQLLKPPCTERYARWCERTGANHSLLLDLLLCFAVHLELRPTTMRFLYMQ